MQCRILFVNVAAKLIGLSAAPHIVHFVPVTFELEFGDVIDPATIVRVDSGTGVTLSFAEDAGDVATASADDAAAAADDKKDGKGKGKGKGKDKVSDAKKAKQAGIGGSGSAELQAALNRACNWGSMAFSHVSQMSDSKVDHIERSFHVGTTVKCRVVGTCHK